MNSASRRTILPYCLYHLLTQFCAIFCSIFLSMLYHTLFPTMLERDPLDSMVFNGRQPLAKWSIAMHCVQWHEQLGCQLFLERWSCCWLDGMVMVFNGSQLLVKRLIGNEPSVRSSHRPSKSEYVLAIIVVYNRPTDTAATMRALQYISWENIFKILALTRPVATNCQFAWITWAKYAEGDTPRQKLVASGRSRFCHFI